jgi:hypothetical protein
VNIFSTIIKEVETFASKAEKELAKLWSKAPKFTDVALTTLTYVGPILETVFTIEGGTAAGAAATLVITKVQQELTAAKGLISAVGPTLSVQSLLSGISDDLQQLLIAANITNPASVANVNLVIGELKALVNAFPVPAPAAA